MNPESWTKNFRGFIMSKKKRHTYAERLRYMHMLEDGYSVSQIERRYGINGRLLESLWRSYKKRGRKALEKKSYTRVPTETKRMAIYDFEEKGLSLVEIMLKYNISASAFYQWRKRYKAGGEAQLKENPRGRPPGMGRPKKKTVEQMTELERLQKENRELKTQVALLKKVRALVEERNARPWGTGHRPSRD